MKYVLEFEELCYCKKLLFKQRYMNITPLNS